MTSSKEYKSLTKKHTPKSHLLKNGIMAFLFGGGICLFSEILAFLYTKLGAPEELAYTLVTVTVILIGCTLTAIGVFDKIAKHAGAGTLVPVCGFANSVTAPALDSKSEGLILGVGAKIFTVAGPVILFGTLSGTLYGIVYFVLTNLLNL